MVFFHCLEKKSRILARGDDVTDGGEMDPTVPSHLMQFYRRWIVVKLMLEMKRRSTAATGDIKVLSDL